MQMASRERVLLNELERECMRKACQFNAQLMDHVRAQVRAGMTTNEVDRIVHEYTLDHGHIPACLGYRGFPKSSCTSVNDVVCHGIPGPYVLKDGDIVNVDLTTIVDGWFGDQSETILLGAVTDEARLLTQVAFDCLYVGIEAIKPFGRVVDIGRAIERHAHAFRFSVVREYQGHGIGRQFHLDPGIPHYVVKGGASSPILPGMCFTVEPMINAGTWKTVVDPVDKWTVRTYDRRLSAQFEHTILVTEQGPEILTLTKDGPQKGYKF